jgi:hypothetical protein
MTHRIVPVEPTDEMLNAARDWSAAKYGKPIGNDAAIGCFQTMLAAAPRFEPTEAMVERVARALYGPANVVYHVYPVFTHDHKGLTP